ncbi:GAF domain-containing protein [Flammeovirgaceae bacterium SG7u.111]|nr:GAF domain-containing protein [Flammeovirgaceae bacterium SG7u.132]WPO38578.1 GAF domain-containing protein [Flammeovirgaceae bacterium SG7u.111]
MLKKLLNYGVDNTTVSHVKERVRLTNLMIICFTPMTLFYIGFSQFYFPEISWIYWGTLVFSVFAIWVNGKGWDLLSSFLLSIMPASAVFLVQITTVAPGGSVNPYLQVASIGFWVMPWLVFSFREKWLLAASVTYCIVTLAVAQPLAAYFYIEADYTMVYSQLFSMILLVSGGSALTIGMFLFQLAVTKLNKEKDLMFESMKKREVELSNSELELKEYISKQEEYKKEEEKQQWVSVGLSQINEVLRNNNEELAKLSDVVIKQLVKYLDANQGGLFISNGKDGDGEVLELQTCYAYERKKYLQKEILPGEGLVGQCFIEKEPIYMTEIPEDYMEITSGLGKSTPKNIIIVPLIYNERVVGVIELASFNVMEEYKLLFVEKVAEGIASVVSNARVNEKTKMLLEDTQQQAEELRTREEEMRQNMEELQATQEAMQRKQQELEEMKLAFEKKTEALETERDELLKKLEQSE